MKIFDKKEEKNKVGRPKLADMDTKKKSIIMCAISSLLVIMLLAGGLVSLNILPNFNRLKGTANTSLCTEIPARFQPRSETNPEGLHEYGFTDPKFYSAVVSTYNQDSTYCSAITEEELASITYLAANNSRLTNADGVQYLTGLTYLELGHNNLSSIDVSHNTALTSLDLSNNNLSSIDVSHNTALTTLNLSNNNLSSIDVSHNTALTSLDLSNNNLSSIDVSHNTSLTDLRLSNNNLSSIDLSKNTALASLSLASNNLSSIDLSHNTALNTLYLSNNNLSSIDISEKKNLTYLYLENNPVISEKEYNTYEENINIRMLDSNIKTTYPDSISCSSVSDSSIATCESGIIKRKAYGTVKVSIEYRTTTYYSITITYNILFINPLSSIDYEIKDKIINTKGKEFDISKISYDSTKYIVKRNNNKLELLDKNSNNVVNTYMILPFVLTTSSNYTINHENKTIDVKGDFASNILNNISVTPSNFQKVINGNKLEIKNNTGTKIDEYKIKNYVLYKLTSSNYTIDYENKIIKAPTKLLSEVYIEEFEINPNDYSIIKKDNKIQIYDKDNKLADEYIIESVNINKIAKESGFNDINLFEAVLAAYRNDHSNTPIRALTDEELEEIEYLECYNAEIKDITGLEKLTNLQGLILYNNNLDSIKLPDSDLYALILANNNISGTLDLSKYENLEGLYLQNNKLDKVVLPNSPNLQGVLLHNNNLESIDLSNYPNLEAITLQNNPLSTIYMLKNATMKYSDIFKMNSSIEVEYEIEDENIATYNNDTIKALKEGITTLKLYNENIASILPEYFDKCNFDYDNNEEYCDNVSEEEVMLPYFMSNEIKVYDIKSDVYKIDKEKKTIDVKGTNLDVSKVTLTLDGLKGSIDGNYYVIKDGNREVDKYKILNPKVVVKETTTTKKEIASTTKSKTTTKSNTTTTKENKDIELSTSIVPSILLQSIKGQDRNIVVTKDNITFTINGKNIENINGNIDLSVEIEDIEKTILKEELKEKVEKAVVLNFKNESELPGKVLVEIKETEEIKKTIGTKDINVYNYNKDKYNLVAENLSLNNNKITFYVDKLGYYVLTNEKVEDKYVEVDDSMMGENTKLNKEIKQKKIIIPIVIIIIILTLGIVGYVRYKKNIKRHK